MTAYVVLISTKENPEFTRTRPRLYSKEMAVAYGRRLLQVVPAQKVTIETQHGGRANCEFMAGRLWWD